MPRQDAIRIEGELAQALPHSLFRVELANGHRLLAHLSGKMKPDASRLAVGDKVTLEMSPFDLSKGCIIERK